MNLDKLKAIATADVTGKRVIVRADLNVPLKDGKVTDATRLERLLPGLQDLSARGARVVVISHFGRPKDGPDPALSLRPVAEKLGELLGRPIKFVPECAPVNSPSSKTCTFPRARRRTTATSRRSSRAVATSSSTMPSRRRTAHTPRQRA